MFGARKLQAQGWYDGRVAHASLPVLPALGCITEAMVESSKALLDHVPYPVFWIADDYGIRWTNTAARHFYDEGPSLCHEMSHAYAEPCNLHGELCPKQRAQDEQVPISVNHAHVTTQGTELFKVTALPVVGGGVLEFHIPLDDVMARDKLTGLHSREFFERMLDRQLALLRRFDRPYSVAMVDLDHFKRINDTYGHSVGDEALEKVGAAILATIRDMDTAGRWGGEEFCLYLPTTDADGALHVCERVANAIRAIELSVPQRVTASVGIATAPADWLFEVVFKMADDALYEAKTTGRDRICTSSAEDAKGSDE